MSQASTPSVATSGSTPGGSPDELPADVRGTWLIDLTRAQIRHDLIHYGFGRYADRFFNAEHIGSRATLAVTFGDVYFEIAWHQPDGSWYVGWYGDASEADGVLTITDAESHAHDSYAWHVTDGALTLDFRGTTTPDQHGIPFEAYSRAYFSRPLRPVDCTPADLDACQ
jgi:hypothetical protein